ncbi:MAG: GNAT family N-acetyltransferase [Bacteroidales bacterium]|nr:GNAT family N-acetyltransferase [Bacteroidales bacterium]
MIKHLTYQEINKSKWDECIKKSFNGIIYGYSWYLDIVCKHWEALVENDYERVFPLTTGKKFGINYLFQPFFTQQLGVFSKNILTVNIISKFLESIPAKYKFVEIFLNSLNKVDPEKFNVTPQLNHELDLINSYRNISKKYSKNTKRNIKKAKGSGITIVKNIKPDEIIKIFRENRGKDIKTLKLKDYLVLKRLIYTCLYKGAAQIYGAYTKENELCAGAVFIKSNKKVIFLFSGTNTQARKFSAMSLLIDRFIEENSESHLTFDFDGSNNPNLARFYKSFGSNESTYLKLEINNLSWLARNSVKLIKRLRG